MCCKPERSSSKPAFFTTAWSLALLATTESALVAPSSHQAGLARDATAVNFCSTLLLRSRRALRAALGAGQMCGVGLPYLDEGTDLIQLVL
jgi:hypothetical protein